MACPERDPLFQPDAPPADAPLGSTHRPWHAERRGCSKHDEDTLAGYFQPVHPDTYADARLGPLLARLREEQPDLTLAVADVDRSQVRDALDRTPEERLRASFAEAETYRGMRVVDR